MARAILVDGAAAMGIGDDIALILRIAVDEGITAADLELLNAAYAARDADLAAQNAQRNFVGPQQPIQATGEVRALPKTVFFKSVAASVIGEPIAFARYLMGGDPINPVTDQFENFNGADRRLLAITGIVPLPEIKGMQGASALEKALISGAKGIDRVDFAMVENLAPGFYRANPTQLRFTQSDASPFFSKGGTIDSLVADIRAGRVSPEQVGNPLQIVMYQGKPFSIDNRRLVAFSQAGLTDVPIQIMDLKDPVVANRFFNRFDPIGGEGLKIVITPSSGRTAAQQLLQDYGLIKGAQIGH